MESWHDELLAFYAGNPGDDDRDADELLAVVDDDQPAQEASSGIRVPKVSAPLIAGGVLVATAIIAGVGVVAYGLTGSPAQTQENVALSCSEEKTGPKAETFKAFQQAYFSGDVAGVSDTLASDSPLRTQAWREVLPVQPSDVCVSVTIDETLSAEAITLVHKPGSPEVSRYYQRIKFSSEAGQMKILTISDLSQEGLK